MTSPKSSLPPEVADYFPGVVEVEDQTPEEREAQLHDLGLDQKNDIIVPLESQQRVPRPAAGQYSARSVAQKKWRDSHPDKVKEYQRRWRERNRERLKEVHNQYRDANPDKVKAWQKKSYERRRARRAAENNTRGLEERNGS